MGKAIRRSGQRSIRRDLKLAASAALMATLAACAAKTPPPPPPPPPPPVVVIPPRPLPPLNASPLLTTPPIGFDGIRRTLNYGITPDQTLWNLRAAYNVAALNCLRPEHADILVGYKNFLKVHAKGLAAANRAVDGEFKAKYGQRWIPPREAYMTQVYNFYASPPTLGGFCDASLALAHDSMAVTPAGLKDFAALELPRLDSVFEQFFRAYEQYKTDAALWDAKYAPTTVQAPLPPAFTTPVVTPTGTVTVPAVPPTVVVPAPAATSAATVTVPAPTATTAP
ncbi:hypothetical protein ACOYW6_06645 [Parablastomonas sp. CN1-191]|uniref:hypothetical protein n=1 Tax=Parablastomonas sp. CN1-191 TaxID=3400908 RepID=UPI003BF927CA